LQASRRIVSVKATTSGWPSSLLQPLRFGDTQTLPDVCVIQLPHQVLHCTAVKSNEPSSFSVSRYDLLFEVGKSRISSQESLVSLICSFFRAIKNFTQFTFAR